MSLAGYIGSSVQSESDVPGGVGDKKRNIGRR